jgi:TRAP-type mannitol/chloroaromatic compound transport system permease small subunit
LQSLLALSRGIDRCNELVGRTLGWLVLAAVLVSACNAVLRKAFDIGSNAFLEVQWYLFAAVFLLGAGYVWRHNGHVRIDVLASRLRPRTNAWIDLLAMLLFTVPFCLLLIALAWPVFERAWTSGEMSENAGGLARWPVMLLIPLGFALLLLQCVAEIIKRVAFLRGLLPQPFTRSKRPQTDSEPGEETVQAPGSNPADGTAPR